MVGLSPGIGTAVLVYSRDSPIYNRSTPIYNRIAPIYNRDVLHL